MLEPPHEAVLTRTHNLCFEVRKIGKPYIHVPQFYYMYIKEEFKRYLFHGHVFLMSSLDKKSCNFEHGLANKNDFEKWPLITFFQCINIANIHDCI